MAIIVATFVLARTLTQQWGATIVLVAQIGTGSLGLPPRWPVRALCGVAAVFFAMATMAALMNLFVEPDLDFEAFVLLAGSGP